MHTGPGWTRLRAPLSVAALLACGCATPIPEPEDTPDAAAVDAGDAGDAGRTDAGTDAGPDAGSDAGTDAGSDAGSPADSGPAFPAQGAAFHELWPSPNTPPTSATNGYWTAQYQFIADTAADALPDLSAASATLHTFSTTTVASAPEGVGPRFGVQVFQRNDGCCVTNGPGLVETHPSWAVAKTFTAPKAGWYHLRAEGVTHFQCNVATDKASWGDGLLLEVYAVRAGVTARLWTALLPGRNCDPAQVSLTEYLGAQDRLVVRAVTHSGDSRLDGLSLDPVVFLVQAGGAASSPPCSVALSPTGDASPRQGAINAAITQAAALVSAACPRAHVLLAPGDYTLDGSVNFGGGVQHVTLRGDAAGPRARLLMTHRTAHILELNGASNELRGLTIDYATTGGVLQAPFTQGTIELVEKDGGGAVTAVLVRIDSGFDNLIDRPAHDTLWQTGPSVQGVVYSSAGAAKTYAYFDGAGRTFTLDGAGRWRLPFAPAVTAVGPGDRVAILARGFGGTFNVNGAENRLTDVTIHGSAELVVRSDFARGFHARRLRVVPGPAVNGALRLVSANADALHFKNLRRGATIEDSELAGLPEDAINTHADGQWVSTAAFGAGGNQTDDWYLVYDSLTLKPGNAGKLVQPGQSPAAVLATFGNRFFNISASGEGTLLRGSKIHELRGNGLVLRGGVALVSQNLFWNIFGGANPDGQSPWGRALNLETQLASCAQATCGGNDEGPYTYDTYLRHNQLLQGDPAGGNTWYTSYTPAIRNQPGAEGCWPWNGGFAALCYPENQDPATSQIVIGPNP